MTQKHPSCTGRLAAVLLSGVLLTACVGPQIFHGQLSSLDKGLSPPEVETRLIQPALARETVTVGGRDFDIHIYRLNNGLQTDPYYLAYENRRLAYWGYMNEFRRQQDRDLGTAVDRARAPLAAAVAAKK